MITIDTILHNPRALVGIIGLAVLLLVLFIWDRKENRKKFRHREEYGSARWGNHKDIAPYVDPDFYNNVILSESEMLTMNSRPENPKHARNKNVLVVGGSGSGKTRFFIKPNLLQMHSSYVVTDPKGQLLPETGTALLKHGYDVRVFNTINFAKSMHYNPFKYVHSDKDILKLVNVLVVNTKGEGTSNDPFWESMVCRLSNLTSIRVRSRFIKRAIGRVSEMRLIRLWLISPRASKRLSQNLRKLALR